jgi:hypothetical protein
MGGMSASKGVSHNNERQSEKRGRGRLSMCIPGDDVLQSESSCPSLVAETKQRLERFSSATRPPSQTGLNSWEVATNGSRERSHHVAVTHKPHGVQALPGLAVHGDMTAHLAQVAFKRSVGTSRLENAVPSVLEVVRHAHGVLVACPQGDLSPRRFYLTCIYAIIIK